ncbi:TetR/AcrR family transcriptional regulator [Afifella pfennigii]|uniref:TetR/AcrR family transcriptional regulator n=1 Tax=Afifella pfennigii TaxID=209897 RepID=UPI00047ABCF4|nr:TetR/AcrR family transcriptional regulator [Afifella pfennigii]
MVGLRARQKTRRRQKIRDSAFALFVEKGYAESSLQEIAERAEVTIPTIYNYFGSKSSLLLEIAIEKQEGLEEKLDDFIENKVCGDPERATTGWIKLVTEGALEALDREVWRSIYQTGLGDDNLGPFLDRLQVFYLRKAVEFLQALKARGLVDAQLDVKAEAKILDSICEHYFRRLIFGDKRVHARYVEEVPALVKTLFRGMARKEPT